jgi:hypothetical protein
MCMHVELLGFPTATTTTAAACGNHAPVHHLCLCMCRVCAPFDTKCMGCCTAGKSTLMDVLSGRALHGGEVRTAGRGCKMSHTARSTPFAAAVPKPAKEQCFRYGGTT